LEKKKKKKKTEKKKKAKKQKEKKKKKKENRNSLTSANRLTNYEGLNSTQIVTLLRADSDTHL